MTRLPSTFVEGELLLWLMAGVIIFAGVTWPLVEVVGGPFVLAPALLYVACLTGRLLPAIIREGNR